jgi:hypothetical protein
MAESPNGGNSNPGQPPKEMSMEVRLLLAFLLMGAVMFVTPYFFKTPPPAGGKTPATNATAPAGQPGQPPDATPTVPAVDTAQPAPAETASTATSASATPQQPIPNLTV